MTSPHHSAKATRPTATEARRKARLPASLISAFHKTPLTQVPASARTETSTGGMVDYDRHSSVQQSIVRSRKGQLRGLVQKIGPVAPEFRLVDYGCGPGRSAIETARPVVQAYREMDPAGRIVVGHADQPGNDWNGLFARASGPEGYGQNDTALRREAIVGSFYDAMAAPGSVSLGTCFTATHWLSRPVQLSSRGTVAFFDLQGPSRAVLAALAEADWTKFLRRRASELHAGGYLLVSGLGGYATPHAAAVQWTGEGLFRAIQAVAQGMTVDGLLDPGVLDDFVFPNWFRTAEELRRPIEAHPDLREAFEIEHLRMEPAEGRCRDPFAELLDDPQRYAESYARWVRGFAHTTLRDQLFGACARDREGAERLTDLFFDRFRQINEREPGRYAPSHIVSTLVLRRR